MNNTTCNIFIYTLVSILVYSCSTESISVIEVKEPIKQEEENTILNSEQTGQVILLDNNINNTINNLKITGGLNEDGVGFGGSWDWGFGITINNSEDLTLTNLYLSRSPLMHRQR